MHTGCRCGEARGLQAEDINWNNRTVTICRTISLGYLRHKTKDKKDRTLPIDDELYAMLKQNRKITGYVFTHVNGNYYKASTLSKFWNQALEDAGVEYVSIHEWGRHSFATQAIKRGVPVYALKEWLGHSRIEMTEKYVDSVAEALKIVKRPPAKVVKMENKSEKIGH